MTPPTATCVTRHLHFRDPRPPLQIQHLLERELMVLLLAQRVDESFECLGSAAVNGATCHIRLRFVAAMPRTNAYFLELTMNWADLLPEHHRFHRQSADSWFDLWTRHFRGAAPPDPEEGLASRYATLAAPAVSAQAHPDSPEAVQQKIFAAMRGGGTLSTSHKEGGTVISWKGDAFIRQDYGESAAREKFPDEAAFFAFLRRFYDWETARSYPPGKPPSEADRWQLMLRLLLPPV